MPLTKTDIERAIQRTPGLADAVRWVAIAESGITARIAAPQGWTPESLNRLSRGVFAGIAALGERGGAIAIEFVDAAGGVVHAARFGGAAGDRGADRERAASEPAGHRPIRGLNEPESPPGGAAGGPGAGGAGGGIRNIIAVGAGKGGVGKSTVAVNLAVGLARRGHAVGLLDGDIYGPSLPTMLALTALETQVVGGRLQPFRVHGVKAMTIGKLVDPEKPLVWRGPMAHGAFKQLVEQTAWGELDYLVIDLPPGTGDVSLTMAQMLKLTGAVVVCTPQKVAQDDAVRAARMFQQLGVEVLGVVENMSSFIAEDTDPPREYDLFGKGGAERMAARLGLPFLGAVPLTVALRENSDAGDPTANFAPGRDGRPTAISRALEALVDAVERQASLASVRRGAAAPTLSIS